MKRSLMLLLLMLAGCTGDDSGRPVVEDGPLRRQSAQANHAISRSRQFKEGPTRCEFLERGWLYLVPRAYPPAQEWTEALVTHGYLQATGDGLYQATGDLPPDDFLQRGPWVYAVRCGDPHVFQVISVRRTRDGLQVDFEWEWIGKPVCGVLRDTAVGHTLRRRHRALASLVPCGDTWCVSRIPSFELQELSPHVPGILQ